MITKVRTRMIVAGLLVRDASLELAKAARGMNVRGVKEAATQINTRCIRCHGVFR